MSPRYAKDAPEGFVNRIEKVTIVGAAGRIGSYFTKHLLATGTHTITALTRAGSSSIFPAGVHRVAVDYADHAALVAALTGQDFLIITVAAAAAQDAAASPEPRLIAAAAAAGVPYVMPNCYGNDPLNAALGAQQHTGTAFAAARAEVERLGGGGGVRRGGGTRCIALATGFWYEWSLAGGSGSRFGCDVAGRTMTFFDDGAAARVTTSTWDQCGRAVAALLGLQARREDTGDDDRGGAAVEDWADGVVYIASFRVSQRDMFESVKRVTGTTDAEWTIAHVDSKTRYAEALEKMRRGDVTGFVEQMYTRVFFPTGEGDATRLGLANEVLGLPEEDIDESTKEALRLGQLGLLSLGPRS